MLYWKKKWSLSHGLSTNDSRKIPKLSCSCVGRVLILALKVPTNCYSAKTVARNNSHVVWITYFELGLRFLSHTVIKTQKEMRRQVLKDARSTLHKITVHRTLPVQIFSIDLYTWMIYGIYNGDILCQNFCRVKKNWFIHWILVLQSRTITFQGEKWHSYISLEKTNLILRYESATRRAFVVIIFFLCILHSYNAQWIHCLKY